MALGTILLVGGSALGAYGRSQQARAESDRLNTQGILAARNSEVSRLNAKLARAQALENARLIRRESEFRIGSLSDRYTASGVALSGTPLLAIQEATKEDELAAQRAELEGEIQATNFINQSNAQDLQSLAFTSSAKAVTRSALFSSLGQAAKTGSSLIEPNKK
jgi:hypothetical protein